MKDLRVSVYLIWGLRYWETNETNTNGFLATRDTLYIELKTLKEDFSLGKFIYTTSIYKSLFQEMGVTEDAINNATKIGLSRVLYKIYNSEETKPAL